MEEKKVFKSFAKLEQKFEIRVVGSFLKQRFWIQKVFTAAVKVFRV